MIEAQQSSGAIELLLMLSTIILELGMNFSVRDASPCGISISCIQRVPAQQDPHWLCTESSLACLSHLQWWCYAIWYNMSLLAIGPMGLYTWKGHKQWQSASEVDQKLSQHPSLSTLGALQSEISCCLEDTRLSSQMWPMEDICYLQGSNPSFTDVHSQHSCKEEHL